MRAKFTLTDEDIYGKGFDPESVIDKETREIAGFGLPQTGEDYITANVGHRYVATCRDRFTSPRWIVRDKPKPRKWVFEETTEDKATHGLYECQTRRPIGISPYRSKNDIPVRLLTDDKAA